LAKYLFPTWKGWLLINPVRLLFQSPAAILADLVKPGMRVLDLGCSMGYFSLPLARMVGPRGRVICVDSDDGQLRVLRRRAAKKNLMDRLEIRCVGSPASDLILDQGSLDLAVLLQVLHYMDDPSAALNQIHVGMKERATLLIGEPKSHVSGDDWNSTLAMVDRAGFRIGRQRMMYNLRLAEAAK
jgi:ubiquinone/menaquinone biosynthesis C-methylase UbiE